jgi:tRNA(Ile)-lysidine synthase
VLGCHFALCLHRWETEVLDALEEKVAEFINRHRLFAGTDRVLLAVSGGADSMALLHALHALRASGALAADLVCGHLNHQLRGAASDGDESFVVKEAAALGVPVVVRRSDVAAHARTRRLSLETAGREVRMETLKEMARNCRCSHVATGHQKDDNAETVIHRLRRGTGLRGLAGIWPTRRFGDGPTFIRPLLCLTHHEIIAYLGRCGVSWREDHTNLDAAYTRNKIRHRLLPALQKSARENLVEQLSELAAAALRSWGRIAGEAADAAGALTDSLNDRLTINARGLVSLAEPVAVEVIRQGLVRVGCGERELTARHYHTILELARSPRSGRRLVLPGKIRVQFERGAIIMSPPGKGQDATEALVEPAKLTIPGTTHAGGYEITATIVPAGPFDRDALRRNRTPWRECLDFDLVHPPVVLRTRRCGDRFQPLGMTSEKKLGKFLTAAGVSQEQRDRLLIVCDTERILWVCPVRINHRARITDRTRRVLCLEVTERGVNNPEVETRAAGSVPGLLRSRRLTIRDTRPVVCRNRLRQP